MKRGKAYARYRAGIGVLSMKGDLLARGAVEAEFRTAADLFDRIGGGAGPGSLKAVAPAGREQVFITVPADVDRGQPARRDPRRDDAGRPRNRRDARPPGGDRQQCAVRVSSRARRNADGYTLMFCDVLIVGAGPAGLAAAIAATKAGLSYQVIEKGALVNSLLHYPTEMVFFTTPELMEIGGLPFTSPNDKPSRMEALRYYRRATDTYKLDIAFDETVASISRRAPGGFAVATESSRRPKRTLHRARRGDGDRRLRHPEPDRRAGRGLPHVSHYFTVAASVLPEAGRDRRRQELGGGGGARTVSAGSKVTIVHRRPALGDSIKYWVKPDIENRIKEGSVAARFNTRLVRHHADDRGRGEGWRRATSYRPTRVFLLTGYISDNRLLRAAGVEIDPETCGPKHDPRDLRNQRQGVYRDRRDGGREGERPNLHRERPVSRRPGDSRNRQPARQLTVSCSQFAVSQIAQTAQLSALVAVPTCGGRRAPSSPAARSASGSVRARRRARAAPASRPARTRGTARAR